jgi:HK97 family phage prohead protease
MAPLVHKKTTLSESKNGLEFVLSSERPGADRLGDIIAAAGIDHKNYDLNTIVLWNHHADQPIGRMLGLRVKDGKLIGNLHLAPKTTSPRLAEIHSLVDAGILRAVSIGVRPQESSPLKSGGKLYGKSELVEVSLVSIPCNVDALLAVKGVSKELKKEIFKEQVRDMSLAERIAQSRAVVKPKYSDEQRKAINDKAKARVAKIQSEKKEADRLANKERLLAESKARIAKRQREEDQTRQDRRDNQGFHWKGEDYFVEWRGHKIPIPEFGGRKCWNKD